MGTRRQHVWIDEAPATSARSRARPRRRAQRKRRGGAISAFGRALSRITLVTGVACAAMFGTLDALAVRVLDLSPMIEQGPEVAAAPQAAPIWLLDLDGDGVADLANPTQTLVRGFDSYGSGQFGASRDHGHRTHEGADFIAAPGSDVRAPVSGVVTKIGFAYDDDTTLQFVELTDAATQLVARVFYIDPAIAIGELVTAGDIIGAAQSLAHRYAGITNHVHVEISDGNVYLNPSTVLPPATAAPILASLKARTTPEATTTDAAAPAATLGASS